MSELEIIVSVCGSIIVPTLFFLSNMNMRLSRLEGKIEMLVTTLTAKKEIP